MKIKKGDNVMVIAGKDKSKTGSVLSTNKDTNQVVVEGVNIVTRHQKSNQRGQAGQVIEINKPVDASNVALIEDGKAVRVGYEMKDGKKVRISRKSQKEI